MAEYPIFDLVVTGKTAIVIPRGDCSSLEEPAIITEVRTIIDRIAAQKLASVVVDLENAPYFGSTMLGAIIKLWRAVNALQGRLILCNVSESELDVLQATRLNSVWPILPSREAALASIGT